MMRVLFIAKAGDGELGIAMRAKQCGHQVKMFLRDYDPVKRPIGKGLVDLVPDWRPHMDWSDLVMLSGNDYAMAEMDRWRDRGARIVGGNAESASWEIDRAHGMAVFRKAGIPVPPFREFRSYDDAISYVKRRDEPFACKPSGACDDKSLSFVGKSPEDTVWRLERWKKRGTRAGLEFILQELVEGVEFAVAGWWGPGGWCGPWEENHEFKKLMPGDRGPNTGEMGSCLRYVRSSKLANEMLKPLEPQLERLGYVGCIDVNCIVDDEGTPWPLEFTMRFGWPAFNIQQALDDGDLCGWLADLCEGRDSWRPRLNEIACGVAMVLPPFPNSHARTEEIVGVPLRGMTEELEPHVHPVEMMMGKSSLESAGDFAVVVTGTGATVREASTLAYRRLQKLSMPASPFYRNDIGARLKKEIPLLQKHGYARGMTYSG